MARGYRQGLRHGRYIPAAGRHGPRRRRPPPGCDCTPPSCVWWRTASWWNATRCSTWSAGMGLIRSSTEAACPNWPASSCSSASAWPPPWRTSSRSPTSQRAQRRPAEAVRGPERRGREQGTDNHRAPAHRVAAHRSPLHPGLWKMRSGWFSSPGSFGAVRRLLRVLPSLTPMNTSALHPRCTSTSWSRSPSSTEGGTCLTRELPRRGLDACPSPRRPGRPT
jgi:hypothetical protein